MKKMLFCIDLVIASLIAMAIPAVHAAPGDISIYAVPAMQADIPMIDTTVPSLDVVPETGPTLEYAVLRYIDSSAVGGFGNPRDWVLQETGLKLLSQSRPAAITSDSNIKTQCATIAKGVTGICRITPRAGRSGIFRT